MPPIVLLSVTIDPEETDPCFIALCSAISNSTHAGFLLDAYYGSGIQLTTGGPKHKFAVKFHRVSSLTDANGHDIPANNTVTDLTSTTHQVDVNVNAYFFSSAKEYLVGVLLHELYHGILTVYKPELNTSHLQHQYMFDNGIPYLIQKALLQVFPSMNVDHALALGLDGMSDVFIDANGASIPSEIAKVQSVYHMNFYTVYDLISKYANLDPGYGTSFC